MLRTRSQSATVSNSCRASGVSWSTIRNYAEQVIPVIRANDPDAVVIVGTRGWSSLGVSEGGNSDEIVNNPVRADNIMYTFHFYAASHKDNYRNEVQRAASRLPLFVTEFGTVTYTGDGAVDTASSTAWLDLLDVLSLDQAFRGEHDHVSARTVSRFLVLDPSNGGAIVPTVGRARDT